ncbi:uncharacterized protein LOC114292306 [Camellia sinensis]|uniref:uncharacterized protein LOC114292306 n=1 Tax=Camellia sinensis TaxID=4442 RepID=UPI001035E6C7|nr:uncharacterized protein LOC114292306 [Camellia sinensis]
MKDKFSAIGFGPRQVDVPVYAAGTGVKPAEIARQGLEEAKRKNMDVVIVDTAGRLQFYHPKGYELTIGVESSVIFFFEDCFHVNFFPLQTHINVY